MARDPYGHRGKGGVWSGDLGPCICEVCTAERRAQAKPEPVVKGQSISPEYQDFVERDTDGSIFHKAYLRRVLPEPFVWREGDWVPMCSYCGIVATLDTTMGDHHLMYSHANDCAWGNWAVEQRAKAKTQAK